MTWLYIQSERPTSDHPHALYTVGHYAPDGTWHPESDHNDLDLCTAFLRGFRRSVGGR